MKFIGKNWKYILIGLLVIILFQMCGGCSKRQEIKFLRYNESNYKDSVEMMMTYQENRISSLQDSIRLLQQENGYNRNTIEGLSKDKQHLKEVNNKLVNK